MTTRHVTLLKAKAVERDGERWIEGYATTPRQDRVGDVVEPSGAVYSLPLPLLFAHKHDEPIGSVVEAVVTKAGIRIRARLTQGVARAEEVWRLIVDGALTAVSVGFQVLKQTPLANGGFRFDQWSWHELSVVSVPANPDAKISVAKCAAYEDHSQALAPAPQRTLLRQFKAIDTRAGIDGSALLASNQDLVSKWLPEWLSANGSLKVSGWSKVALGIAKGADLLAKSILARAIDLEGRIASLERADVIRSLDHEAYESMLGMAERLDQLEAGFKDVQESAIRYRGFWNEGTQAKRGDAYTHDGHAWWCVRATTDQPSLASTDWHLLVRKGRDGR